MTDMINFVNWFFVNLPTFLFTPPVSYIVGLMIVGFVINLIFQIKKGV